MEYLNANSLIAPCGMNCRLCIAYLRKKNKCPGCRGSDAGKPVTRVKCRIKNCEMLSKAEFVFCYQCEKFPCDNLKHLDKRYRTKYHINMIENLNNIKQCGIENFLVNEERRWRCPQCGGTICVHSGHCLICGNR